MLIENSNNWTTSQIYQSFYPSDSQLPLELMEHLCSVNDVLLTDNVINLLRSAYAETKYRVTLEGVRL
jgi:hypothetical protein